ncbi:MAG: hypothetical protein EPN30_11225 [Actinomycetota bacterium]|nr:MAG: hypothetical protein EPN30_11225 [Actinomycetota bacterium]
MTTKKTKSSETLNRLDVALASYNGNAETALAAITSSDPKLRASGLLALHALKKLNHEMLTAALSDSDSTVRRRACELAPSYPGLSLSRALEDPDPFVVEMALWAIGERGKTSELSQLCEIASSHAEPLVREAAVASLGAIGDRAGLETVISALKDRPNVRRRAAVALAAFEGEEVTEALRAATQDRDWQTRQIAEDLLEITEGSEVQT